MSQNQNTTLIKNRAARKKKIAVWNRRLAWVTLPMLLISNFAVYAWRYDWLPNLKTFSILTSLIFIALLLTHSIFSVYLFGFEPYHNIAYALNWIFIMAHVALSTRFMLKRNIKKNARTRIEILHRR